MRDVEELPFTRHGVRIPPRHEAIWVRAGGEWRKGWIWHWTRYEYRWAVWAQHAWSKPWGCPAWSEFRTLRYDPETIRPRHGAEPPPEPWAPGDAPPERQR